MLVSPPSVNQMVKTLEKGGLIDRTPGQPRSIRVRVPRDEIPPWGENKPSKSSKALPAKRRRPAASARAAAAGASATSAPAANVYVLAVYLTDGPIGGRFANKEISRTIEIRGDQTLDDLHEAIFEAYDRDDEHLYEFQFGKRPHDRKGPSYGITGEEEGDARAATLDALELKPNRVFGYWFDFGDDWYHQVRVERIEPAVAHVRYPRVVKRVGKSPPQYSDE
jgi:hypothetical protein